MKILFCVALCCVLVHHIKADTKTIKVGVFEDSPTDGMKIVEQATKYLTEHFTNPVPDIIVFPEYGLTGMTNDKKVAVKIDENNLTSSPELQGLQKLATDKKVILVANLLENDDDDLYSTTVVLDGKTPSTTKLLAKYRKINLRKDDEKSLKSGNDITSFKHSTYGTIGLMSGDDIAFENSARKLLDNNVSTILYTSSKKVVAPFDTTVSLYAGFAKAHGVNLVVSNLHNVTNHISGSGIFTPCGPKQDYVGAGLKYLVDNINTVPSDKDCGLPTKKHLLSTLGAGEDTNKLPAYNLYGLTTTLINNTNVSNSHICDDSFCCNFTVTFVNWTKTEYYRIVVSKDNKTCGLVACSDTDDNKVNENCGRIDSNNKPQNNLIVVITTTEDGDLFVPYILHSDLTPRQDLKNVTFGVKEGDGTIFATTNVTDIVAIGIVAAKSGADSLHIIATNLIVLLIFLKYLLK